MSGEVAVETATRLSGDESTLNIFLHHPDLEGRIDFEAALIGEGATVVAYPGEGALAPIGGLVTIEGSNFTVTTRTFYVIGALEVPSVEAERAKRAAIYSLPSPFGGGEPAGKPLLAASLPLRTSREGEETEWV